MPAGGTTYELVSTADPAGKAFQTAASLNYGATYNPVPPGRYVLNLYVAGNRDKPLKTFDVPLPDQAYATIVVHPGTNAEAPPEAEITMDSLESGQPVDNRLTVRQCLPNARVIVSVARTQMTEPLSFGASQTLTNLPSGAVPIALSIATAGGNPTRANAEAEFVYYHRATMLIVKDSYGRLRPRVIADGASSEPEPKPTPGATAKAPALPAASPLNSPAAASNPSPR